MTLPTLTQAQAFVAEPSTLKILTAHFGCVPSMPDASENGWLMCPDGVERHMSFPRPGIPSAADHYLRWDVERHTLTTTISIDGPRGEVLDTARGTIRANVDPAGLVTHYTGAPTTRVRPGDRRTFNGVPAQTITTNGRDLADVEAAHEDAVRRALTDAAERERLMRLFNAAPAPMGQVWKAPAKIKLPKRYKAPTRKDFATGGFAPGAWFDWTDERDDVTYHCQVQSASPRVGHVWIAGSADGGPTLMWEGKLTHPHGFKGPRTGAGATSLQILKKAGEWAVLATVEATQIDEATLFAA